MEARDSIAEEVKLDMSSVMDVLIILTGDYDAIPGQIREKEEPFMGNLDLDGAVAFERIADELSDGVFDACGFRGFGYGTPVRQFGQLVSLVRRNPPEPQHFRWDEDGRIGRVLRVSRLVHPFPVGLRYSARIWFSADGTVQSVVPGPGADGRYAMGFCVKGQRWYLTENDVLRVKRTLAMYDEGALPERVRRALYRFDLACYEYHLDLGWLALSTALEALIHTDPHRSTKQFSLRAAALAAEIGLTQWTEDRLRDMYHHYRCAVAHGQDIRKAEPDKAADYVEFEELVRQILLRCVEDKTFCQHFQSDSTVRAKWPVP